MKKGFTLIELLAVIVILAIIAVIAVPIVLNIINDSKESAVLRSADFYLEGVETAIATSTLNNVQIEDGTYSIMQDGNVCIGTLSSNTCTGSVLKVEMDGEVPKEGTITITNGQISDISLKLSDKTITKNNKGELVLENAKQETTMEAGKMSICRPVSIQTDGEYTPGDEYDCDVDPNKDGYDHTFYVLNSDGTSVNLIMDSNIRIGGEEVKESEPTEAQKGTVAWISKEDYTREDIGGVETDYGTAGKWDKGPITALEYVQSATKDWTNTNLQTISTFDDDKGNTHLMPKTYDTYARLPYLNEVGATGCDIVNYKSGSCPLWMVNYLSNYTSIYPSKTTVSRVIGYWTFTSSASLSDVARYVLSEGFVDDADLSVGSVSTKNYYGVRPVINLSI